MFILENDGDFFRMLMLDDDGVFRWAGMAGRAEEQREKGYGDSEEGEKVKVNEVIELEEVVEVEQRQLDAEEAMEAIID